MKLTHFVQTLFLIITLFSCKSNDAELTVPAKQTCDVRHIQNDVIRIAEAFCSRVELTCKGKPDIQKGGAHLLLMNTHPLHFYGPEETQDKIIHVIFKNDNKMNLSDQGSYVRFGIGTTSRRIMSYDNFETYNVYENKYARIISKGISRTDTVWPEFMSQEKAKSIFESIAKKLEIPPDMRFERIFKNSNMGVWNGIWLREKDGYPYEGDAVSMSIMGATGELVRYEMTYYNQPCPTEVKIDKDKALTLGRARFNKFLPWTVRNKIQELYEENAKLLIIHPYPGGQREIKNKYKVSRLAWVVTYSFTGGVERKIRIEDIDEPTKEDMAINDQYRREKLVKLREMCMPPEDAFEVRVDAATGEILYSSERPFLERCWILGPRH